MGKPQPAKMPNVDDETLTKLFESLHLSVIKICDEQKAELNDCVFSSDYMKLLAETLMKIVLEFWAGDLQAFSRHAKRTAITVDDVRLLMRNCDQRTVTKLNTFCQNADIPTTTTSNQQQQRVSPNKRTTTKRKRHKPNTPTKTNPTNSRDQSNQMGTQQQPIVIDELMLQDDDEPVNTAAVCELSVDTRRQDMGNARLTPRTTSATNINEPPLIKHVLTDSSEGSWLDSPRVTKQKQQQQNENKTDATFKTPEPNKSGAASVVRQARTTPPLSVQPVRTRLLSSDSDGEEDEFMQIIKNENALMLQGKSSTDNQTQTRTGSDVGAAARISVINEQSSVKSAATIGPDLSRVTTTPSGKPNVAASSLRPKSNDNTSDEDDWFKDVVMATTDSRTETGTNRHIADTSSTSSTPLLPHANLRNPFSLSRTTTPNAAAPRSKPAPSVSHGFKPDSTATGSRLEVDKIWIDDSEDEEMITTPAVPSRPSVTPKRSKQPTPGRKPKQPLKTPGSDKNSKAKPRKPTPSVLRKNRRSSFESVQIVDSDEYEELSK